MKAAKEGHETEEMHIVAKDESAQSTIIHDHSVLENFKKFLILYPSLCNK